MTAHILVLRDRGRLLSLGCALSRLRFADRPYSGSLELKLPFEPRPLR